MPTETLIFRAEKDIIIIIIFFRKNWNLILVENTPYLRGFSMVV